MCALPDVGEPSYAERSIGCPLERADIRKPRFGANAQPAFDDLQPLFMVVRGRGSRLSGELPEDQFADPARSAHASPSCNRRKLSAEVIADPNGDAIHATERRSERICDDPFCTARRGPQTDPPGQGESA